MAQRLMKIRNNKLYLIEKDENGNSKYSDFKDFT